AAVRGQYQGAAVWRPGRRQVERVLVGDAAHAVAVGAHYVDVFEAPAARRQEGDLGVERTALPGEVLDHVIGEAVGHAHFIAGAAVKPPSGELLVLRDVEQARFDGQVVAAALGGSLDQRQGADDRPVVEVDALGGDSTALRVLEIRVARDDAEQPRE